MDIREVSEPNNWNEFVNEFGPRSGAFLHSWEWGEFSKEGGTKLKRIGLYERGTLIGVAQIDFNFLPLKQKYAACLRGPIFNDGHKTESIVKLGDHLQKEYGVMFFRFEPVNPMLGKIKDKTIKPTASVSPKQTLITKLAGSISALMEGMHSKTRYNTRLAERKGVRVEVMEPQYFAKAWQVFSETSQRDRFKLHGRKHYERMLSFFSSGNVVARLVGAYYQGDLLAANIMIDFSDTRTYLHGASSNRSRNVMAPYALHWHEMRDAQKSNLNYYDWWGISDDNPAWAGITRFKRGFGGEEVAYPGTFDYVLEPTNYVLYKTVRRILYGVRK